MSDNLTKYTEEQKEWIRMNYNNPYDRSMFCDKFYMKFNEYMTTEKTDEFEYENTALFGRLQIKQYIWGVDEKMQELPVIKTCQLYRTEPHLMRNGKMSRPQIVYLRHTGNRGDYDEDNIDDGRELEWENNPSFYPNKDRSFGEIAVEFMNDMISHRKAHR